MHVYQKPCQNSFCNGIKKSVNKRASSSSQGKVVRTKDFQEGATFEKGPQGEEGSRGEK